jgi:hypothetical protein
MGQQLDPVPLDADGARRPEWWRVRVLVAPAVGRRRNRQQREEERPEQARDHRAYCRSISARIRSAEYPAFCIRDASSASSMQMSHVAAWPSV